MEIKVDSQALAESGTAIRAIGLRIDTYAARARGRARMVAGDLEGEAGVALGAAGAELARSVEALSAGYRQYGGSLIQLAMRYADLERSITVHPR
jgi:hypothetical protein